MGNLQRRTANDALELSDSIHPLLQRIYRQRKITDPGEIELGLANLLPPDSLKGLPAAIELLLRALRDRSRILIVADFDADGATSCALAMGALRGFGAAHVDYIVPNRFEYGYGLTPEIVELAKTRNPDLIITVDNGISSVDGVNAAQDAGIKVLVTDHHLSPDELPSAEAIVNPNQPGCEFASKSIAGVGVIFYVMSALRSRLRQDSWFIEQELPEPNMAEFLDLVALGTVADVVSLDRNNRILVDEGLRRIRAGHARPGIAALLKIARRDWSSLMSTDLGFAVGPRLNAAGRLEDMSTGIECQLSTDESIAYELAQRLDGMNEDRKQIESEMREQAFSALDQLHLDASTVPAAISLYDSRWHQGVVGILASRVKERFHRPTIAFARVDTSEDSNLAELKGSARSIKGFHIRDALDAIATRNPGLISKFGGHAMAAGLSLPLAKFEEFSRAFREEAERTVDPSLLQATIESDGSVEAEFLNLETAQLLNFSGPWGQDFPEPLFDDEFLLRQHRRVGERHLKMTLSPLSAPGQFVDAIAFNVEDADWPPESASRITLAYRLTVNEFRGLRSLQLMVDTIVAVG
jgi:single-stranded-DNA-specific exonuclease